MKRLLLAVVLLLLLLPLKALPQAGFFGYTEEQFMSHMKGYPGWTLQQVKTIEGNYVFVMYSNSLDAISNGGAITLTCFFDPKTHKCYMHEFSGYNTENLPDIIDKYNNLYSKLSSFTWRDLTDLSIININVEGDYFGVEVWKNQDTK